MLPLPLSLCMIVRDEEHHLADCLQSVIDIVSDIIVVDTGSKDATPDVARHFGATVIMAEWESDFSVARNLALQHSSNPWILSLDADERLVNDDIDYFQHLLEKEDTCGYFMRIINYVGHTSNMSYISDSACRLFRNDPRIRYFGQIHETVIPSIEKIYGRIDFSNLYIEHYGYLDDELRAKEKSSRNRRLIQSALQKHPEDIIMRYALGVEHFQIEEYESALSLFIPLLSEVPNSAGYTSDLVLKTAYSLHTLGKMNSALSVLNAGIQHYPDFTDLLELKAAIMIESGNFLEAQQLLSQTIALGDVSYKYTSVFGSGTFRSRFLMALACERLGYFEEACQHYHEGVHHHPNFVPIWRRWFVMALSIKQEDQLLDAISRYKHELTDNVWQLLIKSSVNARRPGIARQILSFYPHYIHDPLLTAVLASQDEKPDEDVEKLLLQIYSVPNLKRSSLIYLWALDLKFRNGQHSKDYLHRLRGIDPTYATFVNNLDSKHSQELPDYVAHQLHLALLHVGAWDALLKFEDGVAYNHLFRIPTGAMFGFLNAPLEFRQQLVNDLTSTSTFLAQSERRVIGLIALETGILKTACQCFRDTTMETSVNLGRVSCLSDTYVQLAQDLLCTRISLNKLTTITRAHVLSEIMH